MTNFSLTLLSYPLPFQLEERQALGSGWGGFFCFGSRGYLGVTGALLRAEHSLPTGPGWDSNPHFPLSKPTPSPLAHGRREELIWAPPPPRPRAGAPDDSCKALFQQPQVR